MRDVCFYLSQFIGLLNNLRGNLSSAASQSFCNNARGCRAAKIDRQEQASVPAPEDLPGSKDAACPTGMLGMHTIGCKSSRRAWGWGPQPASN